MNNTNKIWSLPFSLEDLNATEFGTIHHSLGIQFTRIGDDFLEATMPVDEKTRNPIGVLHGGASVVLAESLGSIASSLVAGPKNNICVGIEVNASHLRSLQAGQVKGRVTPIRIGKTLHVWNIQISDASDGAKESLVSICRLSVMVRSTEKKN